MYVKKKLLALQRISKKLPDFALTIALLLQDQYLLFAMQLNSGRERYKELPISFNQLLRVNNCFFRASSVIVIDTTE